MAAADPAKSPGLSVMREPLREIGGSEVLAGLQSALTWLQANQEEVNDLNVFPVPDGDTGSNMYLTLRSAVEDATAASATGSAAAVFNAAAHGSLMGARGNSGVILSQVFRGFAQGLEEKPRIDGAQIARALDQARVVAYKAVMKPTEGTILTVVREAAEAAGKAAEESDDVRVVLDRAVREAHASVERTTEMLQVLKDAGVVDAGGFGFAVILEGFAQAIGERGIDQASALRRRAGEPRVHVPDGDSPTPASRPSRSRRGAAAVAPKEEGWGYCTEFLVGGPGLDVDQLRAELSVLGDSALVVGDPDLVRVHIHTAEPAVLIAAASQRGKLSKLKVEDMSAQHHEVLERADAAEKPAPAATGPRRPLGVVSVAPGDGFRDIFRSLGADAVVEGGQTMNPSIEDLLTGVRAANADSVILLPNNKNVILTAEQVDALADDVAVHVVPSHNVAQGIAALLALEPDADAAGTAQTMEGAMRDVHAVEVTHAVRDSAADGRAIKEGDVIALLDDHIVEVGDEYAAVIERVLTEHARDCELVTVYRGGSESQGDALALLERLRKHFEGIEFELQEGGQEHYPYVLSLE